MCTDDCINKGNPNQGIERRSFLSGATAAVVGVTLGSELLAQQRQPPTNALNDPTVIQDFVSFKSGTDMIQGYLARPSKAGRFRAVVDCTGTCTYPKTIATPPLNWRKLVSWVSPFSVFPGHRT